MAWLSKLYRWLWTKIGGRPWTYIIRDIYHLGEWFVLTGTLLLGVLLGKCLSWGQVMLAVGICTVGYIAGHCFWGTPYTPGQPGEEEGEPK